MHLETLIESLPDTTAMVLVGFTFVALALFLKKRLIAGRVEPTADHGPTSDN
jgi:hypothetical protein